MPYFSRPTAIAASMALSIACFCVRSVFGTRIVQLYFFSCPGLRETALSKRTYERRTFRSSTSEGRI